MQLSCSIPALLAWLHEVHALGTFRYLGGVTELPVLVCSDDGEVTRGVLSPARKQRKSYLHGCMDYYIYLVFGSDMFRLQFAQRTKYR